MRRLLSTAVSKNFEISEVRRARDEARVRPSVATDPAWSLGTDFAGGGHGAQILLIGCV
jgi:hypothetical protein